MVGVSGDAPVNVRCLAELLCGDYFDIQWVTYTDSASAVSSTSAACTDQSLDLMCSPGPGQIPSVARLKVNASTGEFHLEIYHTRKIISTE